jgi:SEC-C motif domain protein
MTKDACPCHGGAAYKACCAPFHRGDRVAWSPEELIRSRYAAFSLRDGDYLVRTIHPDHEDGNEPRDLLARRIREGARKLRFMGLSILETRPADDLGVARGLFVARIFEGGRDRSFAELSEFVAEADGLRYRGGTAVPLASLARDATALTIDTFPGR